MYNMICWCILVTLISTARLVASEKDCTINSGDDIRSEIFEDQPINVTFVEVSTSGDEDIVMDCNIDVVDSTLNKETGTLSLLLKETVLHYPDEDPPKVLIECRFSCSGKPAIYLYLTIKNVHNIAPVFLQSPYEYDVSEFTAIGTTINPDPIVMFDGDYPEIDPVMELSATEDIPGRFEFISQSPAPYSKFLHLYIILKGKLDFSKEPMYSIHLTVMDKGDPPSVNHTTVTINVIDEDDKDPIFENFIYYTEIIVNQTNDQIHLRNKDKQSILYEDLIVENSENLPLRIEPKKIFAFDQDFGINASINYALGEGTYSKYFKVNEENGNIFLAKFEEEMIGNYSYIVPLEAYQTDNNERRAKAALEVKIAVVNPIQPHFAHPIYILKNLLANDNFYQVGVVQNEIKYGICDAENQYISINETSGSISLLQNASQLPSSFHLDIAAKTSVASISNKFQGRFEVVEQDLLKTPLFNKSVYFVEISKSSAKGDHLFKMEINDPKAELHLMGSDSKYFEESSNWIVLKDELVEGKTKYSVTIEALTKNVLTMDRDKAEIIFQVTDSECHQKIFDKDVYFVEIPEWKINDSVFSTESALPDVKFSLSGEYSDHFSIESDRNMINIYLRKKMSTCNRTSLSLFGHLIVPPFVNGSTEVILQVTDQRCYAKIFESDSYVSDILSNWEEDYNILNLTVSMPVSEFHLLGDDSVHFNITSSGHLYLAGKLDVCRNYKFLVLGQATEPVLRNETTQIILLSKEPKCYKPFFESDSILINISSEWEVGGNIFNVSSEFPEVLFTSEGKEEYFEINNATGQLFLIKKLDKCENYVVSVHGSSTGPPPREGVTKLIFMPDVCIKMINEFSKCVYKVDVKNKEPGRILLDFRKSNESPHVKFEISEGNNEGLFDIKDGKLVLTRKPTVDGRYFLKVTQKTNKRVSRSIGRNDIMEVSNTEALVVVDIGERKSQIRFVHPSNQYKLFLPTAPLSDYWFTVKAIVEGEMNSIKFSIESEDNKDFEIDASSGLVSPKVDVTKKDGYEQELVILATAKNGESKKLSICIYRLRQTNAIGITLKSNSANVMKLKNIASNLSTVLQCDVHILRYEQTNSEGYELMAAAIKDNRLLTFGELEERMKNKTEDLEDVIGDFSLAPYTEKLTKDITDKKPKVDPLLISTILLACLLFILCALLLIYVVMHKFKSNTADFAMPEVKEPLTEREVVLFSNLNHSEVPVNCASEVAQPESSDAVSLDIVKMKDTGEKEGILSNGPTHENYENNSSHANEDETNVNYDKMIIQPELNNHAEETTVEDSNLLTSEEDGNQSYCNETFEETSFNDVEESRIDVVNPDESPTNELETMAVSSSALENNEKKTSVVKFNDIATLIP